MSASPIVGTDLNTVTEGATACDHLKELANTRAKMKQLVEWLVDGDGHPFSSGLVSELLSYLLPGSGKEGWLVRTNPSTGILELVVPNDLTQPIFEAHGIRLVTLDVTDAVANDVIVFNGTDWVRKGSFVGAPTSGGTTIPAVATGGVLLAPHGLSAAPDQYGGYAQCTSAENGFAVGDRIDLHSILVGANWDDSQSAVAIGANTTNVWATFTNRSAVHDGWSVYEKSGALGQVALTPGSWNVFLWAKPF